MKILVVDVAAETGGALTVLQLYYQKAMKKRDTEWIFVLSKIQLPERENIKILNFPWVKKSWFHRLAFDLFVVPKLVKQYKVDQVLSLQNLIFPLVKVKQSVYLHQALPFSNRKYSLLRHGKLWIYQNIIGKLMIKSIKKADNVIVQMEWMKRECIRRSKVHSSKIVVEKPEIEIEAKKKYEAGKGKTLFFYPASDEIYKNHKVIIEAVKILIQKNISDFRVIFTIRENKNSYLAKTVKNLPIDLIGPLTKDEVYDFYQKSILLFPSYIETVGLPLLEAKKHHAPIIAANLDYAREVLNDYDKVKYFNPDDPEKLAMLMYEKMKEYNHGV